MTFAETLLQAAMPQPIESHPLVAGVRDGSISREEIRAFALHLESAAEEFVCSLYAVLSVCTNSRVRHALLGNVLEEEGAVAYTPGVGIKIDPARSHLNMARTFAREAGVSDADLASYSIGPPRWFRRAVQDGNWIGPFAYMAVGTEANVPPTYRLLIPALRENYGFSEEGLEFLIEHVTADDRHGIEGAQLIASVCHTDEARRQALEGARRGGHGWWEILRKHALGSARRPAPEPVPA